MATTIASASTGLLYAHIPLDEPADLALGVTAVHHPRDDIVVLLLGVAVLFRAERNDGQQIFHLREYPLFDHLANLFIRGPARIFATVLCPRPQRELDDLVAEVLRVGNPGGLLDLRQLLIEQLAVEQLA